MLLWFLFRAMAEPLKTRNRTGIRNLLWRAMERGQKVTLAEAIAILRANW